MGRLCGGAHEISGIKAPLFLRGGVGGGGWWRGWLEGSWGGCVCVGGVHGGVSSWRVNGMGAYTHPPMNSYNIKRFNFMNTHPPIHHIESVTLLLYIYSPMHEQL